MKETGGGNVLDQLIPVLESGWLPYILTFVAQGQAPYLIAYGNASIAPQWQMADPQLLSVNDNEAQQRIKTVT